MIVASGRLPPEKVHVVYAGVDLAVFDPARASPKRVRAEWSIGDSETLLVQVGVREWKGWRDVIDAVSILAPEFPSVEGGARRVRGRREDAGSRGLRPGSGRRRSRDSRRVPNGHAGRSRGRGLRRGSLLRGARNHGHPAGGHGDGHARDRERCRRKPGARRGRFLGAPRPPRDAPALAAALSRAAARSGGGGAPRRGRGASASRRDSRPRCGSTGSRRSTGVSSPKEPEEQRENERDRQACEIIAASSLGRRGRQRFSGRRHDRTHSRLSPSDPPHPRPPRRRPTARAHRPARRPRALERGARLASLGLGNARRKRARPRALAPRRARRSHRPRRRDGRGAAPRAGHQGGARRGHRGRARARPPARKRSPRATSFTSRGSSRNTCDGRAATAPRSARARSSSTRATGSCETTRTSTAARSTAPSSSRGRS